MARKIEVDVAVDTKDAVKNVDKLSNSVEELNTETGKSGEALENMEEGLDGVSGGFGAAIQGAKGLLSGFKALVANPIGLVLTAVAAVVTTLYNAFARTEEGSNTLNKGLNFLKAGFSSFMKALQPVAEFIVDGIAAGLDEAGKAMDNFLVGLEAVLDAVGLEDAAEGVKNFADEAGKTAAKVAELSDLEAKLLKTRREQRLIEKQALIDAEDARQIRDDESKTMQERIAANEELGRILKRQGEQELAIANDALRVANLKLEIDGKTTENLDELAEAQLEILDIQERINGFESEQLVNVNALNREQSDKHTEYMDRQKEKLDILRQLEQAEREAAQVEEEEGQDFDFLPEPEEEDNILESTEEQDAKLKELAEQRKQEMDEELAAEEAMYKAKDEVRANSLSNALSISDSLTTIFEGNKELQIASIIADTAVGTAKIIQSTLVANAKSVAAFPLTAGQPFVGINTVSAGLGIAANLVAAKKALSTIGGGGSPSGGGGGIGGGGGSASAPPVRQDVLTPTSELEGAETEGVGGGAGINQQPVRAIVLESDITETQNTINNLKERSEIG